MSKFLVTGGAGFIGSHIVDGLVARGDTVVVLDNFATGKPDNLAQTKDRITLIEGSITDPDACQRAVQGMDFVLHQAALPSVPRSVHDPVTTNAVNVNGTLNMLLAARDQGVKRFVFAGSSSAYGNTTAQVKSEDLPPNPLSPYAIQKYTGELYCQAFHRLYRLETIILRYFNVFGPRQDPKSQYAAVIPLFITQVLSGQPITIYGDGEQARDFTYVANVVQANLLACEAPKETAGQLFNAACGHQTTVNRLAQMIMQIVGKQVPIQYEPPRPGDVNDSLADISRSKRLLQYSPETPLEDGLAITVACYTRQHEMLGHV